MSYYYLTAILTAASSAGLSMALGYPEVLLDPPSFGDSLMGAGAIAGFAGLFASGVALVLLARNDSRPLRRRTGVAAGLCVAAGAMLGLTPLSGPAFAAGAIVAPLLQALWTLQVSRRPLAVLAALGLAVTAARSVVWAVNAAAPLDGGFHITSAVLTVVALPGQPLWAAWLIWAAGRRWRNALLAAGLVAVQAFLIIVGTPTPATTDMPAVPSAAGQLRYVVSLALREQFALPATYEELLAERARRAAAPVEAPAGTTLERVDAGGVPAEKICATGAAADRVILNLPGGGFILPPSGNARRSAANLSRAAGACVLMVHYRLAPEHPFPAAMQDGVSAYRWLRRQSVPGARIAIVGDSAGGNLTLATALSLRDSGDEPPAALVAISGIMDFTLSAGTWRTKASGEVMIRGGTVDFTVRGYTGGVTDPRDPLLSPLYADVRGLPPTLLMVGSQEVLLGDAIRMAGRLREAGVPVRLEVWPGAAHSWSGARKETMESRLVLRHITGFIGERLS